MRTLQVVSLVFFAFLPSATLAQSTKWVKDAEGSNVSKPCSQICEDYGGDSKFAVRGGLWQGQTPYFVCAGQMEGWRPGYQVTGVFGNACNVGHDGKDKQTIPICLCSSSTVKAE